MKVRQFTVQKLLFIDQHCKNFRAFGAIQLHIQLFRQQLFRLQLKNHYFLVKNSKIVIAPSAAFPHFRLKMDFYNKLFSLLPENHHFWYENSVPLARFPHSKSNFLNRNHSVSLAYVGWGGTAGTCAPPPLQVPKWKFFLYIANI